MRRWARCCPICCRSMCAARMQPIAHGLAGSLGAWLALHVAEALLCAGGAVWGGAHVMAMVAISLIGLAPIAETKTCELW